MKKCNSTPIYREKGINEERCKEMCDDNGECNYIFWNDESYCALYEDCVQYRTSKWVGTVFAKKGQPLDCPGKIIPFTKYHSIMPKFL